MENKEVRAEVVISGLVQGVGFRYYVYREALKIGAKGIVKNLYDGSVFVIIEGERFIADELIEKIKIGPMHAHVKDISVKWLESKNEFSRFEIDY